MIKSLHLLSGRPGDLLPTGILSLDILTNLSEVTSTPTRPVDNVVITTKGLQDRNIHILDGTTVDIKGKLIVII